MAVYGHFNYIILFIFTTIQGGAGIGSSSLMMLCHKLSEQMCKSTPHCAFTRRPTPCDSRLQLTEWRPWCSPLPFGWYGWHRESTRDCTQYRHQCQFITKAAAGTVIGSTSTTRNTVFPSKILHTLSASHWQLPQGDEEDEKRKSKGIPKRIAQSAENGGQHGMLLIFLRRWQRRSIGSSRGLRKMG